MRGIARDFLICILIELLSLTGFVFESHAGTFVDGARLEICGSAGALAPFAPPTAHRSACPDCLVTVLAADPQRSICPTRSSASCLPTSLWNSWAITSPSGSGAGNRGPPALG
jgi:hypothetical protein